MKNFFISYLSISILAISFCLAQQNKLKAPSRTQLEWANAEIGVLIHFDLVVFEPSYDFRADWNYHPSLSIFDPKELDTDQWIRAAKAAGAKYAVLVAKHCTG
ncbi:MAG: alpha-L-fucosidase, partial [Prolixibacteraceae bacterium]